MRIRGQASFGFTSCVTKFSPLEAPRNLSGRELGRLLRRYGYDFVLQDGSHMRFTTRFRGVTHHVTIPDHNPMRLGTQNRILGDVAAYLGMTRAALMEQLFGG